MNRPAPRVRRAGMVKALALLVLAGVAAASAARPCTARAARPSFDRVVVVVLENTDFTQAIQMPFLKRLAGAGALLTDFHAVAHASYPNYLAMVAGSTLGVHGNWQRDFDVRSLPDLLEASQRTWRVYAENLPSPCFLGPRSPDGLYVRRHQPLISMRGIQTDPARCRRIVNASALAADLAARDLADYSLYIPNLVHDGHDSSIARADAWLRGFLEPLLADTRFMRGTLVGVTFDENAGGGDNHIYTALLGDMVGRGVVDGTRYDHYSLLRTIEENFRLGTLDREDSKARSMCCVWRQAVDTGG